MIIDTKKIKAALVEELKTLAATDKKRACFVQFGSDAASTVFVRMKMKLAAEVGIEAVHIQKMFSIQLKHYKCWPKSLNKRMTVLSYSCHCRLVLILS
jgi:5,10-methylene-tetrahydrofolate dehydrogenase/methenyl tetrahydrofolate cyclohydrolase